MTEKRQTRAELEAQIAELSADLAKYREVNADQGRNLRAAAERDKEAAAHINDLKERLANAESENQRMRGYIARVQEDDVVREDLVKVGDPDGDHQLVPKRKPASFVPPVPYLGGVNEAAVRHSSIEAVMGHAQTRRRPRHWVTY